MNKLLIVVCLVLFTTVWPAETRPQGCTSCGASHEDVREKCCNDCDLCRASFEMEEPPKPFCPCLRHTSYNVERIINSCPDEVDNKYDADIEVPLDPDCIRFPKTYYKVNRPPPLPCSDPLQDHDFKVQVPTIAPKCRRLKLSASVHYNPRDCQCDCNRN
ncbi:uncharacterized protein LOC131432589 isoform X2 [Malaya genurostris]|uniref:uncharacterized protein LOC131432589 isoform X2 n=1 Tax=Malaya genurostris TaxID=325434 RepID=UPI0026F3CAC2|nr:uncharacterized protein LOC131432589 isoform X2 [Malaya genurostris]